jgi:hypothetical protein
MQEKKVVCSNCGQSNDAAMNVCFKCGNLLPAATLQNRAAAGTIGPGRKFSEPYAPGVGIVESVKPEKRDTASIDGGYLDRYDDGGVSVFACVSGIITAILALIFVAGKWVSLQVDAIGFSQKLSLLEVSDVTKSIANVTQYFDADSTSILHVISLASTVAYWILLIGAIVSIIVSVLILIFPNAEVVLFIPFVIIIAFAVIGLAFTAVPIIFSQYFGILPIPIIMTIVAGIPAIILKFLA